MNNILIRGFVSSSNYGFLAGTANIAASLSGITAAPVTVTVQ
jgi:hypothetical protein